MTFHGGFLGHIIGSNLLKMLAEGEEEMGFFAVPVLSDWTILANAWTDIKAATGFEGRDNTPDGANLYINLWEGTLDPDDYACLYVCNGNAIAYNNHFGDPAGFTTSPTTGTAYIIGIDFSYANAVPE